MNPNVISRWAVPEVQVVFCARADLKVWAFSNAAESFWRLYWHPHPGPEVELDGKVHQPGPDDILLIAPETPFKPRLQTREAIQFFVHFYVTQEAFRLSRALYRFPCPPWFQSRLQAVADSRAFPAGNRSGFWVTELVCQMLGFIPAEDWQAASYHPGIRRALQRIHQSPGDELGNPHLAAMAHVSTPSFLRQFREATGVSPHRYVTQVRMEHACRMLVHTHLTIEEICMQCGFMERGYFTRVFSRETGESPAAYRKRRRRSRRESGVTSDSLRPRPS